MTLGMYMCMPAADCQKALKLTFFVALFSQSITLATVMGWLGMIRILLGGVGGKDEGAVGKYGGMVKPGKHGA